jgi:hypothetical protein
MCIKKIGHCSNVFENIIYDNFTSCKFYRRMKNRPRCHFSTMEGFFPTGTYVVKS